MKTKARQIATQQRKLLSQSSGTGNLIQNFPVSLRFRRIAGFAPIKDEIDIWPLLRHLHAEGRTICLPVTPEEPAALVFRRWTPESVMKTDRYGVSYPIDGEVVTPDLVLVPLLAFTPNGKRLGYGGGYYDRTLAKLRAEGDVFACGVAYAGQEVADLPTDDHDERLDGILTEKEFRTFK